MSTDRVHHFRAAALLLPESPGTASSGKPFREDLEGLHARLRENVAEAARRTNPGGQTRSADGALQFLPFRRQQGMALITSYTDLFVHLRPMLEHMRQLREAPSAPIPGARFDTHHRERRESERETGSGWLQQRQRRRNPDKGASHERSQRVKAALDDAMARSSLVDPADEHRRVDPVEATDPDDWQAPGDEVLVEETIVVSAGQVFDGKGKRYKAHPALNDRSRGPRKPVFRLEPGGRIENARIAGPDGIHAMGDATFFNVWWKDAGRTAFAMKRRGCVKVIGGGATNVADSVFCLEAGGSFFVEGFAAHNFGSFIRSSLQKSEALAVNVKSTVLRNGRETFLEGLGCRPRAGRQGKDTTAHRRLAPEPASPREEIISDFSYVVSSAAPSPSL